MQFASYIFILHDYNYINTLLVYGPVLLLGISAAFESIVISGLKYPTLIMMSLFDKDTQ